MQSAETVQLNLLGRFHLHRADGDIRLPVGKTMLVLAFLACARQRTARRDRLASLFWQDSNVEQARASLRQALSRLRSALGDARDLLWSDNDQVGLTPNGWSIDIDLLLDADGHGGTRVDPACVDPACVDPARVDPAWADLFLSGVHRRDPSIDAWLESERQRFQQVVGRVFQSAIDEALAADDATRALELGIRLSALSPYAEPVHRSLMLAHELNGDRASALRQYRTLVRLLDEGLGVAPDEETRRLFERLRQPPTTSERRVPASSRTTGACRSTAPFTVSHASDHARPSSSKNDRNGSSTSGSVPDVAAGLRLVTVLAMRHDSAPLPSGVRSEIDTIMQQQGGESILSHGAESLYVFGMNGTHVSGAIADSAIRAIRQVHEAGKVDPRPSFGCASGLVNLDEQGYPIGSVVQRAARLALLSDDGEAMIDRAVKTQLSTQIDMEDVALRNMECFRVVDFNPRRRAESFALFGRTLELAQLRQLLEDSPLRGATMAVISGGVGMGKTHLVDGLQQAAQQANWPVLRLSFGPHEAAPLSLHARLARLLHDALIDSGAAVVIDEVQQTTLKRLLTPHPRRSLETLPDNEDQHRMNLLTTLAERLSSVERILIVAEDCHWAEVADINLLINMVDSLVGSPVLLVATERREHEAVTHVLQTRVTDVDVVSLTLTPLSRHDARALVESQVSDARAQARILARAGGHPLFITQLMAADLDPDAPVPESVVALVQSELDRLSDQARRACLKAAVLGPEVVRSTLESIFPDIDMIDLLQSNLIIAQDSRLCFRHALVHEAVYTLLNADDLARLHTHAATWLSKVNPGEYAHHALRSGDVPMAIEACVSASAWLLAENRHPLAERLVERGLSLQPDGDALARLLLTKAQLRRDRGELEEAIAACRQAHDQARDPGLRVRALVSTATLLKRRNELERAAAQLRQASMIADEHDVSDDIRAELEHEWGNNMFMRGQPDRCRSYHQRALKLAGNIDDVRMRALALGGLGDAFYAGGKVRSAHRHFQACIELADSADLHLIGIAHRPMWAYAGYFLDPRETALDIMSQAVDEARRWKSTQYEMLSCCIIVDPLVMAGRNDECEAHLQRMRELQNTFGGWRFEPDILYSDTIRLWAEGDVKAARRQALRGVREFGNDTYMGASLQGALALVTDDESVADKALGIAGSLLETGGLAHNRATHALLASACHWRRGDYHRAIAVVGQAQESFGSEPVGLLDAYLGWMQAAAGNDRTTLDSALSKLDRCGLRLLKLTHPPARLASRKPDGAVLPAMQH